MKRLIIGPYRYLVRAYKRMPRGSAHDRGFIMFGPRRIGIFGALERGERAEVLWHEVNHGIVDAYSIPLGDKEEEEIVTAFSKAQIAVFRANPELLLEFYRELTDG